jgi:hypothetical protein
MATREKEPRGETSEDLDLTVGFHTRISKEAEELLHARARARGIKPATFGRQLLYMGLGLIGSDS